MADPVAAFYDRLAADYHLIYPDWDAAIARQARVLDRLVRDALGPGPFDILDCACGIGTQALGLAMLGHRVTGSDLSTAAIARAREEAARRGLALTLKIADLRSLAAGVPGAFDIVLAADNALPHLLSKDDLARAACQIAAKLRPGGVCLASIRDYDALGRSTTWPARFLTAPDGTRWINQQVWEWLDARCYRVTIHITRELADGWRPERHVGLYRALARAELTAALQRAGLVEPRWLMPPATGYHQPIVLARKPGRGGGKRCA